MRRCCRRVAGSGRRSERRAAVPHAGKEKQDVEGRSITVIRFVRRTRPPWLDPAPRCRRGAASWPRSSSGCEGPGERPVPTYQMSRENFSPRHRVAPVHLRPAGHPRDDIVSPELFGRVSREIPNRKRPWADQAHVAFEDIPQFRQLVEARASEKRPRPVSRSASGSGWPSTSVGHRAELDHREAPSCAPSTPGGRK